MNDPHLSPPVKSAIATGVGFFIALIFAVFGLDLGEHAEHISTAVAGVVAAVSTCCSRRPDEEGIKTPRLVEGSGEKRAEMLI